MKRGPHKGKSGEKGKGREKTRIKSHGNRKPTAGGAFPGKKHGAER